MAIAEVLTALEIAAKSIELTTVGILGLNMLWLMIAGVLVFLM